MRMVFLVDGLRPGHGVAVATVNLAGALARAGHDIVLAGAHVADSPLGRRRPFQVHPLPPVRGRTMHRIRIATGMVPLVNALDADVYVPVTFPYDRLAGRLNVPTVCYDHGAVPASGAPLRLRPALALVAASGALARRRAHGVVTVSAWLADRMARLVDPRKIFVVQNGVDHLAIPARTPRARADARQRLGIPTDAFMALTVGRLSSDARYKGVHRIAAALGHRGFFRRGLLCAVGWGTARDRSWLAGRGVTVLGCLDDAGLASAYAAADLYVTASCWEGFNLPLLEAQAVGLPVAALDRGAHQEVVADSVTLAPSLEVLADQVMKALGGRTAGTPERRRAFAACFTWSAAAERFTAAVDELLNRPTIRAVRGGRDEGVRSEA